ncbi:tetratricopeptide repeat protein [Porifericola rhodea]|uniref:ATP-binding protein n=1 Tax=Porifericola rhodea TaxID=930972 RepID=UPI002666E387|nr:ATP-binding protein [Porifericola rhodea]WKN33513.1 tetratricopeptide repeat protein [Porifericola rhodea]
MDISNYATSPKIIIKYAKLALEAANSVNNDKWKAAASLNIAQGYKLLGDNEKALNSVLESINYYLKADSEIGVAAAYISLGDIYAQLNNNKQAKESYNKAIKIFRTEHDSLRLATVLLNAGELFHHSREYDSALQYYNEAHNLFKLLKVDAGVAYGLGNLGLVKASQKEYEIARAYLDSAIVILKEQGDNYAIAEYLISLAEIHAENEEIEQALELAHQSLEISEHDHLLQQMRNASKLLSELYTSKEDFLKAFKYQSAYILYRDSINNEEVVRNMADMRTEFEVEQKQTEINLLNESRKNERLVQLGLALLLVFVLALTFLIYRNYNLQKRNNQQLEAQKKTLSEKNQELDHKNKELDALIATREKFFSIISHDLRSPVNAFSGLSSILKSLVDEKQYSQLPQMVSHLEKSAHQLTELLDNLLGWAVNQQSQIPIKPENLSVKEVAEEVLEVFQTMAITKRIKLACLVKEDTQVWADKNALFTILRNLINNALKFTSTDGSVIIEAYTEQSSVVLQVRDTGVGMSKEKVKALFNSKGGERTWGTSGEKGVGLGLQLVNEFVERSDGYIKVKSTEGKGTTFIITLPAVQEKGVELSSRLA